MPRKCLKDCKVLVFTYHEKNRGNIHEVSRKTVFPSQLISECLNKKTRGEQQREKNERVSNLSNMVKIGQL